MKAAPGLSMFPVRVEQRLAKLLRSRLEVQLELILTMLRDGVRPTEAIELTREAFSEVPFETAKFAQFARIADRFSTRQVAKEVGRQLRGLAETSRAPQRKVDSKDKDLESVASETAVDHEGFATEVERRARGIERKLYSNLNDVIVEAVRRGSGNDEVERVLQKQFRVTANAARFIARDRMGSLNVQISRTKHRALGFTHYRWVTSEDVRVRPEHAALNGQIRAWNDPHPTEGHPGDAPNCRCVAVPVMPDELEGDDLEKAVAAGAAQYGTQRGVEAIEQRAGKARRKRLARAAVVAGVVIGGAVIGGAAARGLPAAVQRLRTMRGRPRGRPGFVAEAAERSRQARTTRLPISAEARRRQQGKELFRKAHEVARGVRAEQIRQGVPEEELTDYATTFLDAIRKIAGSRNNDELRQAVKRLSDLGRRSPYRGRRLRRKKK